MMVCKEATYKGTPFFVSVPEWAQWVAMDADLVLYCFFDKPEIVDGEGEWNYGGVLGKFGETQKIGHRDNMLYRDALARVPWDKSLRRLR